MGRPMKMATREKISAAQKERWRKRRAAEIGETSKVSAAYDGLFVGYEADLAAARKAAEEARDAAKEASISAGSAAASAARSALFSPFRKGALQPDGSVIVDESPSDKSRVRRFFAPLIAPIHILETRIAIWLWFLWFILYLITWLGLVI